jgi:hypothetical protein
MGDIKLGTTGAATIIAVVILSFILCGYAVIWGSTPDHYTNETFAVSEKYPTHSYKEMCGKGIYCTYTDLPKIVDTEGKLWTIQDETMWAKMKINHTYTVQYAHFHNNWPMQSVQIESENFKY